MRARPNCAQPGTPLDQANAVLSPPVSNESRGGRGHDMIQRGEQAYARRRAGGWSARRLRRGAAAAACAAVSVHSTDKERERDDARVRARARRRRCWDAHVRPHRHRDRGEGVRRASPRSAEPPLSEYLGLLPIDDGTLQPYQHTGGGGEGRRGSHL
jgi:hypothetical protein